MRRIFILVCFLSLLSTPKMLAQFEGTFGLGVHTGYGAGIKSLGAGVHAHYYYTNNIRFAPSFTSFLERKGSGMWMADVDAHYVFPVSYAASLYPIAGLHYSQWRYNPPKKDGIADEGWKKHLPGANLGLGFQYDIAYRIRTNYELKYQLIPNHSQVLFTAGIGFWF